MKTFKIVKIFNGKRAEYTYTNKSEALARMKDEYYFLISDGCPAEWVLKFTFFTYRDWEGNRGLVKMMEEN